jgi:predicted RNase H-like nuclease (RuvC/YqgF family)
MTNDLLPLDYINEQYLCYNGLRGCKIWIRSQGVSIIKLGKKYFVKESEFNQVIKQMKNRTVTSGRTKIKRVKNIISGYEDIYQDLLTKMNEV